MIVIIDNYDSFTYNLYQSVAQQYDKVEVFRNDKITLPQIQELGVQGIIISPGPGRPEQAGICVDLVRTLAPTIPILGVCLGHQSIGIAFGAEVCLAPKPVHGKDDLITHHGTDIYSGLPMPLRVGRYHSLIVAKQNFPQELIVDAENDEGIVMGMRHKEFPCFGVQFHPESILTPDGDQLIANFIHKICQC